MAGDSWYGVPFSVLDVGVRFHTVNFSYDMLVIYSDAKGESPTTSPLRAVWELHKNCTTQASRQVRIIGCSCMASFAFFDARSISSRRHRGFRYQ